jgi:hypothetical protein
MIVERITVRAKFGQDDAVAAFTAWRERCAQRFGRRVARAC